jgi:hypothetical protein
MIAQPVVITKPIARKTIMVRLSSCRMAYQPIAIQGSRRMTVEMYSALYTAVCAEIRDMAVSVRMLIQRPMPVMSTNISSWREARSAIRYLWICMM